MEISELKKMSSPISNGGLTEIGTRGCVSTSGQRVIGNRVGTGDQVFRGCTDRYSSFSFGEYSLLVCLRKGNWGSSMTQSPHVTLTWSVPMSLGRNPQ